MFGVAFFLVYWFISIVIAYIIALGINSFYDKKMKRLGKVFLYTSFVSVPLYFIYTGLVKRKKSEQV